MNRQRLEQLAREWRTFAAVRTLRWVYVAACLAVIALEVQPGSRWLCLPLAVFLAALIYYWRLTQARHLDAAQLARHLDRTHPELEESSRLWLRPAEGLTLLERLQLARLNQAAERLAGTLPTRRGLGQPPRYVGPTIRFALVASILLLIVSLGVAFRRTRTPSPASATLAPHAAPGTPAPATAPVVWPKITGGGLTITPPAYTGHPPRQATGFNAEIEEGALVEWSVALDRPVREAHLIFGSGAADRTTLQPTKDQGLRAARPVAETTLYTLAATLPDGTAWTPPEIYSLKVIKDRPPTVRIVQPAAPRTVIVPPPGAPSNDSLPPPAAAPSCFVEVQTGDDYGVADAHLVATVAKGSGEAVKFREQTIPFDGGDNEDGPVTGSDTARRFTRTLDLAALGLEPGDELYFYVEARDNRQPTPNRTRSETRFLVLQGTDKPVSTPGRGVAGVNLVPQYFRSERQLIIDTEKLLADRPTLPDKEFRARANDLGADQALLRLRYGQFLGEDQETDPLTDHTEVNLNPLQARAPERQPGPRAAASITERFRQEHAAQDAEGGSDESRDASLRAAPTTPLSADQVRQPYVDSHDTHDKATFFDQESKGTMKDALSAMWAAEGALRIAQPRDALAPEHRALDILKDLQQSARAYVQHVGFDAPPLKIDERRLKGDAAGVPSRLSIPDPILSNSPAQGDVRAALAALSGGEVKTRVETLRRVEPVLTAAATRQPDEFLPGLQTLHRLLLADGAAEPAESSAPLERALLRLLPPANPLPARAPDVAPSLDAAYFQALQTGEAKR